MLGGDIRELKLLADLEGIAERYEGRFGAPPVNLSVWDPAPDLVRDLALQLPDSSDLRGIDYHFSYELPEREPLLGKLDFDPSKYGCLITHSGSAGIIAVANWLRIKGCSKVLIVGPRYFTVPYALTSLGLDWRVVHMRRSSTGGFHFPDIERQLQEWADAVWLTNPIYCTSIDYNMRELNDFVGIAARHNVRLIFDECLAETGRRIGPSLSELSIVGLYSPHKSVCVNGVKFAAVVFEQSEQEHFDTWCDVWNGCIPVSTLIGTRHFLSSDFEHYRYAFRKIILSRHLLVRGIAAGVPSIILDNAADGYLITIYVPRLSARLGLDVAFLERAATDTGAIFISGARNELDPAAGLSFRLNLAAMNAAALGAFTRLCYWLDEQSFV